MLFTLFWKPVTASMWQSLGETDSDEASSMACMQELRLYESARLDVKAVIRSVGGSRRDFVP